MQENLKNKSIASANSDLAKKVFLSREQNPCLDSFSNPLANVTACDTRELVERFVRVRNKLPSAFKSLLTAYSYEDYLSQHTRLFLTNDNKGGVGVTSTNELVSLFSYPRANHGNMLVEAAKFAGATHLSHYEISSRLTEFYQRHGFRVVERVPFDPIQAGANWNYQRFGTPHVIRMSL